MQIRKNQNAPGTNGNNFMYKNNIHKDYMIFKPSKVTLKDRVKGDNNQLLIKTN